MLTVIVDEKTEKGKTLLAFVQKLNASDSEVRVRKFRQLTDAEMALPGNPPSEEQFDEWLKRPDKSKPVSAAQLLERLDKKFKTK